MIMKGLLLYGVFKLFAIMKIRSGIRIAFADMGGFGPVCEIGRVARPGPGTRQPGAGQPRFPQATAVRTQAAGPFPTGVLFRRALVLQPHAVT